jgi:queuosine precursor transporter
MGFKHKNLLNDKSTKLFLILGGFFIGNAMVAEFLGVKIFSVEQSLGINPANFSLFGKDNLSFNMSAGVLNWPFVFLMTDIINEYFGKRGVRFLSFLTAGLIAYAFFMFYMAIGLSPADFWVQSHISADLSAVEQADIRSKVGDYNYAFRLIFGQGMWIILGSLTAFLFSQLVDVFVFHQIKKRTGEGRIWLRTTGSTLVSQLVDSYVVLFIAFYLGAGWDIQTILVLGLVAYVYKFIVAILMTPFVYLAHNIIEQFLGDDVATELKSYAATSS